MLEGFRTRYQNC